MAMSLAWKQQSSLTHMEDMPYGNAEECSTNMHRWETDKPNHTSSPCGLTTLFPTNFQTKGFFTHALGAGEGEGSLIRAAPRAALVKT